MFVLLLLCLFASMLWDFFGLFSLWRVFVMLFLFFLIFLVMLAGRICLNLVLSLFSFLVLVLYCVFTFIFLI